MQVKDIMTGAPEESVEDCCKTMEGHQVRQVPVVDELGSCCGMVAQADVARRASTQDAAEVVKEVSRPTAAPSRSGCC